MRCNLGSADEETDAVIEGSVKESEAGWMELGDGRMEAAGIRVRLKRALREGTEE